MTPTECEKSWISISEEGSQSPKFKKGASKMALKMHHSFSIHDCSYTSRSYDFAKGYKNSALI